MKNAALIVKEDGLIYVNEVPEEPHHFSSDYLELRKAQQDYEAALASAKENAVLCADQEKAKEIIKAKFGHDIDQMNINTKGYQYPIPGLEWEVQWVNKKGGMSGRAEAYAVAILTLSEQPKQRQKELLIEMMKEDEKYGMYSKQPKGEESQEELWMSAIILVNQAIEKFGAVKTTQMLMKQFTITRNLKENQ